MTAVEWLIEKLSYSTSDGTIISHHFIINKLVEQAKKMEKEQIKNAWLNSLTKGDYNSAEEYYNQTYKQEGDTDVPL
jgi:dTDP-glucose pyrophosphorylase